MWREPLPGLRSLEALAGGDAQADLGAATAPAGGFSPADGLWRHDGWRPLESAQAQVRQLAALSELLERLGARPAADGVVSRGASSVADAHAAAGAELSALAPRELSGLERTTELSRLIPSEISLLAAARGGRSALRREFVSRLVRRRLLGYSLDGFDDARARPLPKRRRRLARSRGGPLDPLRRHLALDGGRPRTPRQSGGARGAPRRPRRRSSVHRVRLRGGVGSRGAAAARRAAAAADDLRPRRRSDGSLAGIDRPALNRLLDFMGHAFGGGTDVASPLRRALATLEPGAGGDVAAYAGADIILVSDGELPSPPVDAPTMARLEAARRRSGVEVHGLLIGEARPTPLDEICDEVHTFLCEWDPLRLMRLQTEEAATKAAEAEAARQRSVGRRRAPAPVMSVGDDGGEAAPLMGAIQAATAAVEAGLVERGCEARLLLLALVGGEHLLLLGPPGTAKSEVCRRLGKAARLAAPSEPSHASRRPSELFGPLSLAALERDEYKRATDGYAPKAELLFLDEAFKANSAILNSLLTLLNERLFDDGAARAAPLRTAVAASNELPDSDELDALYDRFLLRRVVRRVSDDGVLEMLARR